MYSVQSMLRPFYTQSRALLIGINEYQNAAPLSYAVSDALGVKQCLIESLGFSEEHITVLQDHEATRENILREYMKLTSLQVETDERIIVFFAGHGATKDGITGEVGFLVPVDATPDDLSTMIRWSELTSSAELIRAKHILFIMDACYGGLAVNRSSGVGTVRYLEDLLCRVSRQVITAGKADQAVSDAGGPIPNHSIFTGHLIEGLQGKAANEKGIITASSLMAYVCNKVSCAPHSRQTPHYGQFFGDGDFILLSEGLEPSEIVSSFSQKEMVALPVTGGGTEASTREKIQNVKKLISDPKSHILLHDMMLEETRKFLADTNEDFFPVSGNLAEQDLVEQIQNYESATEELWMLLSIVGRWGTSGHVKIVQHALARSCDRLTSNGGRVAFLRLRWYPLMLMSYSVGISALYNDNYEMVKVLFETNVGFDTSSEGQLTTLEVLAKNLSTGNCNEIFRVLSPEIKYYYPFSEHMFSLLQPKLDDVHFLGRDYEFYFDQFEMLFFLAGRYLDKTSESYISYHLGRFAYKETRGYAQPLTKLILEAERMKNDWAPIRAGMFGGDYSQFEEIALEARKLVQSLNHF